MEPAMVGSWQEQQDRIAAEIAKHPATFGLAVNNGIVNTKGETFRFSQQSSYVNDADVVMLYTEILRDGKWLSFAKEPAYEWPRYVIAAPVTEVRTFACPDVECGAVFSYGRSSLGHFVEPGFCPQCGGIMGGA
jgi:hypothetical protein